jgi:hypothetical protein
MRLSWPSRTCFCLLYPALGLACHAPSPVFRNHGLVCPTLGLVCHAPDLVFPAPGLVCHALD